MHRQVQAFEFRRGESEAEILVAKFRSIGIQISVEQGEKEILRRSSPAKARLSDSSLNWIFILGN